MTPTSSPSGHTNNAEEQILPQAFPKVVSVPFLTQVLIGISLGKLPAAGQALSCSLTHSPFTFTCLHLSISCSGLAPKAFLLLTPPWSTHFKGQKVTLKCRDSRYPAWGDVSWYYNKNLMREESGEIQIKKSGYYKCKTQVSSFSDPVHVEFLSGKERKEEFLK